MQSPDPLPHPVPRRLPPLSITELRDGSPSPAQLPTGTLLSVAPAQGGDVERVSTGTKFALGRWLETRGQPGRGQGGE